jgi:hypothetical protein
MCMRADLIALRCLGLWRTATDTGADWVVITSWNEWWENTQVEPSERYGRAYLEQTKVWAHAFKASTRTAPIRDRQARTARLRAGDPTARTVRRGVV